MIALVQRVRFSKLEIQNRLHAEIGKGLLILLGIDEADDSADAEWLAAKISKLRVFSDSDGKMNLDIRQIAGEAMVVSQFTLMADPSQGNRPSYSRAARPEKAIPLYEAFNVCLSDLLGKEVKTGVFGADMQIQLCNDGPVTISIDSMVHRNRKG